MDAIVAVYGDWGIGADGTQPIALRADRKRFREVTEGAAVIVGRRTLKDFPGGRPLKNRRNIVLSRRASDIPGAEIARTPEEAMDVLREGERCFVIGGASVYRAMLPFLDQVYVTKLEVTPLSDSFFPNLDTDPAWYCAEEGETREEDGVRYRFCVYKRLVPDKIS